MSGSMEDFDGRYPAKPCTGCGQPISIFTLDTCYACTARPPPPLRLASRREERELGAEERVEMETNAAFWGRFFAGEPRW